MLRVATDPAARGGLRRPGTEEEREESDCRSADLLNVRGNGATWALPPSTSQVEERSKIAVRRGSRQNIRQTSLYFSQLSAGSLSGHGWRPWTSASRGARAPQDRPAHDSPGTGLAGARACSLGAPPPNTVPFLPKPSASKGKFRFPRTCPCCRPTSQGCGVRHYSV